MHRVAFAPLISRVTADCGLLRGRLPIRRTDIPRMRLPQQYGEQAHLRHPWPSERGTQERAKAKFLQKPARSGRLRLCWTSVPFLLAGLWPWLRRLGRGGRGLRRFLWLRRRTLSGSRRTGCRPALICEPNVFWSFCEATHHPRASACYDRRSCFTTCF
jgi:hypothetical protein